MTRRKLDQQRIVKTTLVFHIRRKIFRSMLHLLQTNQQTQPVLPCTSSAWLHWAPMLRVRLDLKRSCWRRKKNKSCAFMISNTAWRAPFSTSLSINENSRYSWPECSRSKAPNTGLPKKHQNILHLQKLESMDRRRGQNWTKSRGSWTRLQMMLRVTWQRFSHEVKSLINSTTSPTN